MTRTLLVFALVAASLPARATSDHTITVDGDCSEWAADEKFPATDGRDVWVTWDATFLYVAFRGGGGASERRILVVNTNPGVDDNALLTFDRISFPRNGTPDYFIEASGGALYFSTRVGSSQNLVVNPVMSQSATGLCGGASFLEMRLARALFNGSGSAELAPGDDLNIIAWSESSDQSMAMGALPSSCNASGATPQTYSTWMAFVDTSSGRAPTMWGGAITPSVTVVTAPNVAFAGAGVTLTATVYGRACGGGQPTGIMGFLDGNASIGSASPMNGVATYQTFSLAVGMHAISSGFPGMLGLSGSRSAVRNVEVVKAETQTALTSSPTPVDYSQNLVLTATVTRVAGGLAPTGMVSFEEGVRVLGSSSLDANGVGTLAIDTLSAGTHDIIAKYLGDASSEPSTSLTRSEFVVPASTGTALMVGPATLRHGDSAMLTASVTTMAGGSAVAGSVTFSLDGHEIGIGTVMNGSAVLTSSALTSGMHSFSAVYSGDANHAASTSPSVTRLVQPATTMIAFTAMPTMANVGVPVTLNATVSSTGGTPAGAVSFLWNGNAVATISVDSMGRASTPLTFNSAGMQSVRARYEGSGSFASVESSDVVIDVQKGPSATTLTAAPSPSMPGQQVTLTARITPAGQDPMGIVRFLDGSTEIGAAFVQSGSAMMQVSSLAEGTHALSAEYSGDLNLLGGSSPVVMHLVSSVVVELDAGEMADSAMASLDDAGPERDGAVDVDAAVAQDAAVAVMDASVVADAAVMDAAMTDAAMGAGDSGAIVTTDAGTVEAADAAGSAANPPDDKGCGCETSSADEAPFSVVAALIMLGALRRVRTRA